MLGKEITDKRVPSSSNLLLSRVICFSHPHACIRHVTMLKELDFQTCTVGRVCSVCVY